MKRYLLGFFGALALELLALTGLVWMALANWLFSDSPLWFDVLFVIGALLPFPLVGDLVSRGAPPVPPRALRTTGAAAAVLAGLLLAAGHGTLLVLAPMLFPVLYRLGWHWGRT